MPNSLNKKEILRGYQAFSRAISSGRTVQRGPIRCFYVENPASSCLRVGFSVSRAVHVAASRNKARRWMKESYRLRKHVVGAWSASRAAGFDVVFLFSTRPTALLNRKIRESIDESISSLLKELNTRFSENR